MLWQIIENKYKCLSLFGDMVSPTTWQWVKQKVQGPSDPISQKLPVQSSLIQLAASAIFGLQISMGTPGGVARLWCCYSMVRGGTANPRWDLWWNPSCIQALSTFESSEILLDVVTWGAAVARNWRLNVWVQHLSQFFFGDHMFWSVCWDGAPLGKEPTQWKSSGWCLCALGENQPAPVTSQEAQIFGKNVFLVSGL